MLPSYYNAEKIHQAKEQEWNRRDRQGDYISREKPIVTFSQKSAQAISNKWTGRVYANKKSQRRL